MISITVDYIYRKINKLYFLPMLGNYQRKSVGYLCSKKDLTKAVGSSKEIKRGWRNFFFIDLLITIRQLLLDLLIS